MVQDGLRSVRGVVDNTAVQQESRLYSPFGEVISTTGSPQTDFGFTGEQQDDHLVYLRARYMNPALGAFLSLDPLEGDMTRPMSLNRYAYVEQNPINFVDPSGLILDDPYIYSGCQQSGQQNTCMQVPLNNSGQESDKASYPTLNI